MRPGFWRPVVVMALAAVMLAAFAGTAAAASISGAIWTTDIGGTVNQNFYDAKPDVYLNGGPVKPGSAGLPAGDYYVRITDPSGSTVLGRSWNSDSSIVHRVHVGVSGEFDGGAINCWNFLFRGSSGFTAVGYDDTPNNGGEYKVWLSTVQTFDNDDTKTDNFKVANPDIIKVWRLRVPTELLARSGVTYRAFYTADNPLLAGADWDFVDLAPDPANPGYVTATTWFSDQTTIWFYFSVTVEEGGSVVLDFQSPVDGPEALTFEGSPYINLLKLSLKSWEFTVPVALRGIGVDFSASYTTDDPDDPAAVWSDVALADGDADGVYTAETLFLDPTTISYRFVLDGGGYHFDSGVLGPETITGAATNVNPYAVVYKHWSLTPPAAYVDRGYTFKAQYTTDTPADDTATWVDVALADGDADGTYTADTIFADPTSIAWRFVVSGTGFSWTSAVAGPEELTGTATIENDLELSLKSWEFTVPVALRGIGVDFSASYTTDDPDDPAAVWSDVALADGDADGVYTAETLFLDPTTISYRFVLDGGGYHFDSGVLGPETITGAATNVNPYAVVYKHWSLTPPAAYVDRGYTFKAQYTTDTPADDTATWVDVALADGDADGTYTADTIFADPTSIAWRFVVSGTGFSWTSAVAGPEELTGTATVNNDIALSLKSWRIRPPADFAGMGLTYKAYYTTDDPAGPTPPSWTEVALTEDPQAPGEFIAETIFLGEPSIYYKFTAAGTGFSYESPAYGPEVISGVQTITNELDLTLKRWIINAPVSLAGLPGVTYSAYYSLT
ncbi:MAG: hypothetical protein FDZ75_00940, partial [Actinobacteria bacterium]